MTNTSEMDVMSNSRGGISRYHEDLILMGLVAAKDRHAQRVLAHRLAGRVRHISQRLIVNSSDADDASQLALIAILRSAGTYSGVSSVERWADRITTRIVFHYVREQRKRSWFSIQIEEVENLPSSENDTAIGDEVPQNIKKYLARLPQVRREVLVLKYVLGYTIEEIATITDTPFGTVKERLCAARRYMRKMIQRDVVVGARNMSL